MTDTVTTQATNKKTKAIRAAGLVLLAVGIGASIVSGESESPSFFWPGVAVFGFLLIGYSALRRWWHNS